MLHIFNTLTKKKEIFNLNKNTIINIYVCGMTVYSNCHIGHARTFIIFDLVIRYLKYLGYKVNYIRNITDIDDKIIKYSKEKNLKYYELTEKIIIDINKDLDYLNLIRPTFEPKVTESIEDIIKLIKLLIKKKHVYKSSNGDLFFSVKSFPEYGKLSNIKSYYLKSNINSNLINKKNNMDFVVWKLNSNIPYWNSPWGKGRPGWHIECSSISKKFIKNNINIHGGGIDLLFPHHENELAQSYCGYKNFNINTWMHVGSVVFFSEKMSKSLENYFLLKDVFNYFHPETIKYFLMMKHYRNPINYNINLLYKSELALNKLYKSIDYINTNKESKLNNTEFTLRFIEAINDDFNIPKAYSILFELSNEINKFKNKNSIITNNLILEIKKLGSIIGILQSNPKKFLEKKFLLKNNCEKLEIVTLINRRNLARKNKNWKIADKIRLYLKNKNIILEDLKDKTIWKKI